MPATGRGNQAGLSAGRRRQSDPNFRRKFGAREMTEEIRIERLGHGGDGIAQGPLYAPRTLPGEVVRGERDGSRFSGLKIVHPSPDRIKPACAHYAACGGCALQHASALFVSNWKRQVVVDALAARGITAEVDTPIVSPPNTRRRATFSARRTKKGALVGFHAPAAAQITPVPTCHVLTPRLLATLPALEKLTSLAASRSSEVRYTVFEGDTGIDLAVTEAKPLTQDIEAALTPFAQAFARITWNGELALCEAAPGIAFGTARVEPPPGAFLQATRDGEAALTEVALTGTAGAKSVVDLFSGCGTFTFPVAVHAAVHAVEGEAPLLDALAKGSRHAQGLKPISTEKRDLFRNPLRPDELARFDAAIIDPPRAGAEAQTEMLAEAQLPKIVMISCNPVTFARDVARLIAVGYQLGKVHVVDQFRWSPHIEVAAILTKDS